MKFDKTFKIFWAGMFIFCLSVTLALSADVARAQAVDPNTIDPLHDIRYCGAPKRNADGSIKRSSAVTTAFQMQHPCPSTGLQRGACPGWAKNHALPLACGGCDAVWNMYWANDKIKSCASAECIDRYERKIYASDPPQPDTAACVNKFPLVLPP